MTNDSATCPFCGEEHEGVPTDPNGWLGGVTLRPCPKIPQDHIYADSKFEKGPDGQLFRIEPEAQR